MSKPWRGHQHLGLRPVHAIGVVVIILTMLLAVQCDKFSFYEELDGPSGSLTIRPEETEVAYSQSLTFLAEGGIKPYRFAVNGSGTIDAETGAYVAPVTESTESVIVTDAYGNTATATVSVVPTAPLAISPAEATLLVGENVSFGASGGVPPYTYSASGGGAVNSSTGTYTAPATEGSATVTVQDERGDEAQAILTIVRPLAASPLSVELLAGTDYTFTATGGVAPLTWSVAAGDGTITGSGGSATYSTPSTGGSATVRVTDASGTFADASVTITVPTSLAVNPASVTVAEGSTVAFAGTGGVPDYTYSIASSTGSGSSIDPDTGAYAAGSVGTDVVRVTDDLDNTVDATVTVYGDLAVSPTSLTITEGDTTTFTASGGVSPYTFAIASSTAVTAGTVNATTGEYTAGSPGTEVVRVTDEIGNTVDVAVGVFAPVAVSPASATIRAGRDYGFTASGGVGPLVWSIAAGDGSIDSSTGVYTAPATAGSATVRVADQLGTQSEATVTVVVSTALTVTPGSVALVAGDTTTFAASDGLAPYTYERYSSTAVTPGTVDPATGAYTAGSAGTEVIRATDDAGNTGDATVTVVNPLAIVPATLFVETDAQYAFSATGGLSPYTFGVVSGTGTVDSSTGTYTAPAAAGSAIVQAIDAMGTTRDAAVTIYEPLEVSPASLSLTVNSSTTFSAAGGVQPYTFSVESGGGTIDAATGAYTAPASDGTATVRVTDDAGNYSDALVTVTVPKPLAISPTSTTVQEGGTATFSASGGTAPYTYSRHSGDGSVDRATGEYTAGAVGTDVVRVTDAAGNQSDATVTVVLSGSLIISPTSVTVPVGGQTTFGASGGAPPYIFSVLSGGGSVNADTGLYSAPETIGTATVRVTDSNSNTADATLTIAGAGCGQLFAESEPNDDKSPPWTESDDFGIILVPGCTTYLTGTSDRLGGRDVFAFNTGSAEYVSIIVEWASGANSIDFSLYDDVTGNKIAMSKSVDADSEVFIWKVDKADANRYVEISTKDDGGIAYSVELQGH